MSDGPVLVVGASGLVGAQLKRAFEAAGPVVGTALEQAGDGLGRLDIRDRERATGLVRELRPRAVVCAAAIPSVERCELEPEATRAVNVNATLALADAARAAGATFVFLSSEYVYDGRDGPYGEDAPRNPINEYGRQKAAVEEALERSGDDHLVARISCVYGPERRRKNFVYQLAAALGEGRPLRVPSDQIGTPTSAPNAAEAIRDLVGQGERGVFNVVGPDRLLRSEFALIAARLLGLDERLVEPTPTPQLGLAAPRPTGAGLLNDRASAASPTPLVGVEDGLRQMIAREPSLGSA